MKRSQVESKQQFMCASLQRRTLKLYSLQGPRRIMHVQYIHLRGLYCTVCVDSLLLKGYSVPKQKLHQSHMHQYLTADHFDHCWYSILPPPSCSILGPHPEAAGYNSNFNMDQC